MTKEQAIKWAGSGTKLARLLGIKPQAVYLWADGEPIPELRQYQIAELKRRKRNGESRTATAWPATASASRRRRSRTVDMFNP